LLHYTKEIQRKRVKKAIGLNKHDMKRFGLLKIPSLIKQIRFKASRRLKERNQQRQFSAKD
jgi:hypothetical protein